MPTCDLPGCPATTTAFSSPLPALAATGDAGLPAIHCRLCGLVPPDQWDQVPREALDLIERRKSIRRESRGGTLFHQGDGVDFIYRLLAGVVLLRKMDHDGNTVATHMVVPGQTFGFLAFVDGRCHAVTAQCASDAVVCRIPAGVARRVFESHPSLQRVFARHVGLELSATEDSLLAILDLPVRDRLLRLFSRFADLFGETGSDGGCRFVLPMLRSDVASLAGIARESFSRRMAGIECEGLVHLDGNQVVIASLARLDAAIGGQAGPL